MDIVKATDVRKEWSATIDSVVRERPMFIKRTRDYVVMSDAGTIECLLEIYDFSAKRYTEEDGTVTLSLNELDLAENATDEKTAKYKLAESMIEYAKEYYEEFYLYSNSPNRKKHIPYVLRILMINDPVKIGNMILCQDEEN